MQVQPRTFGRRDDAELVFPRPAELEKIALHEARHTYASLMIAAGVNAKAVAT